MLQKFAITRSEAHGLKPAFVDRVEQEHDGPPQEIRYVLAWAVGPDGVSIPGPGEPDADMIRAWAESAVRLQLRAGFGGRNRISRPRNMPVPDFVVDSILVLAQAEHEVPSLPAPALMARVAQRLRDERVERPEPVAAWTPPVPRPVFRKD